MLAWEQTRPWLVYPSRVLLSPMSLLAPAFHLSKSSCPEELMTHSNSYAHLCSYLGFGLMAGRAAVLAWEQTQACPIL